MLRFDERWLESTGRDKNGHLKKPGKKRSDGIPDITSVPKGKMASVIARLEQDLAPSVHAKALTQLANKPELLKGNYEHWDQVRYFDFMHRKHREIYDLLHATPNGGARSDKVGFDMKAEGQKKGYPDATLDAARGVYHGLRLELKFGKGKPTPEQLEWQQRLRGQGYCYEIVVGWEMMVKMTLRYWLLEPGESITTV
ncbi:VRR-NUC domain-containing protein [Citrobacter freundii]|uniref:VRR-NUC domain-containing protein n=1 Tax=Citrobacter freundii TaxID=546 RepID=UPI0037C54B01